MCKNLVLYIIILKCSFLKCILKAFPTKYVEYTKSSGETNMELPRFQAKPRLYPKHVSLFGAKCFESTQTILFPDRCSLILQSWKKRCPFFSLIWCIFSVTPSLDDVLNTPLSARIPFTEVQCGEVYRLKYKRRGLCCICNTFSNQGSLVFIQDNLILSTGLTKRFDFVRANPGDFLFPFCFSKTQSRR